MLEHSSTRSPKGQRPKPSRSVPHPPAAMEFGFRAGNSTQRRPSPDRRVTAQQGKRPLPIETPDLQHLSQSPRSRAAGPFHGDHPPPSPLQWEAAARRERIKREVERRLIEEEVRLELALERARLHGGFGPAPFLGTDGSVVPVQPPPPPPGRFSRADGPSMTPAMSWDDSPRRLARFEQPMLLSETGTWSLLPKPRHTLLLREIAPSESSEVREHHCRSMPMHCCLLVHILLLRHFGCSYSFRHLALKAPSATALPLFKFLSFFWDLLLHFRFTLASEAQALAFFLSFKGQW